MLSVNDLIDINYIPSEDEISLQLLVDFYEEYLCKKIYIFTLKNGKVIKLFFRDGSEIFHVSGIDHIYEGVPIDGSRFLQGVKDNEIDLNTVENVNAAAYKDYILRIRSMACIDTIIKKCEYLWYPEGKIPDSQIEVKYLLLKGLDEKNLHLGIDTYKENRPYFTKTLLVTEGNTADKFIGKADERLRVAKLEIRDKDTNELLVCVEREVAEGKVKAEIKRYTEEWYENEFQSLILEYLLVSASTKVFDFMLQKLNYNIFHKIISTDSDIQTAFEMKESITEEKEWIELFLGIFGEKLSDMHFVNKFMKIVLHDFQDYELLLLRSINRDNRSVWKTNIKKMLADKRTDIHSEIDKLDCYTSGKILGDAIREYEKDELNVQLNQKIEEYISQKGEKVVKDILLDAIEKQKKEILHNVMLLIG